MKNVWIILTLSLVVSASGETVQRTSDDKTLTEEKDLYLDDGSGGYPVDDDDFNSGSGSGSDVVVEEVDTVRIPNLFPKMQPTRDSTKVFTPKVETSTAKAKMIPKKPTRTEQPDVITEEGRSSDDLISTTSKPSKTASGNVNTDVSAEKHPESLFQRKEVLAAVIAGGIIGFLFAIFLILLLVYRMRKKDEGSYDLGERKPSSTAYQKAPTKEFYA
ncbi:syndecan-2 [Erpetoichthys calabaricus]|uniref:Syndecan n=1 Tax=Erpetoichthys calabaricus TaxID=27687 RepID=A0A8C4TGX6_ERPCA|nr:syndecan-2 [Erpetoichthys calabaricus]